MIPSVEPSSTYANDPKLKRELIQGYAPRPCPHRLKLMSFLDIHEDQRFDDPFVKHLEACDHCRDEYLQMGREYEQLNRILPWIKAPPHDLELWKRKIQRHTQNNVSHSFLIRLAGFPLKEFWLELRAHLHEPRWLVALSLALMVTFYLIYS